MPTCRCFADDLWHPVAYRDIAQAHRLSANRAVETYREFDPARRATVRAGVPFLPPAIMRAWALPVGLGNGALFATVCTQDRLL